MTDTDEIFRPVPRTGVIFVMSRARERGFHYGSPDWVNLGQGAPETGTLEGGIERLEAISVDPSSAEYAPVMGSWELREAVAELYNARYREGRKSRYTADNVAISAGGRLALSRVATALGPVHLGHLLPDYTAYEELLDTFHSFLPIPVPLDAQQGFQATADRLGDAVRDMGLRALLLSNPSNPTGRLVHGSELEALVAMSRERRCALVVDEFYSHYVYELGEGTTVSAAAFVEDVDEDPVILLDGLTKNWRYPGLRLAWTVGPAEVVSRFASAGSFLDGGAPHPLQRAAIPLLTPERAGREARAIQRRFTAKRDRMVAGLRALGLRVPEPPAGAFYCFASVEALPEPLRRGDDFFEAALAHKVICVPGRFFDVNPGRRRPGARLDSYLRFSFGPEPEQVEEGLVRLGELIRQA